MKRFDKENNYNQINTDFPVSVASTEEEYTTPFAGYLFKKSSSGDWQKRYFEINGNYLIYYKNQSMAKLLAAVSIPQIGDIKIVGEMKENQKKGDGEEIIGGYVIQMDLKEKQYFLRTETYEEAEKWVKHLIYIRDGEITAAELKTALNASPASSQVNSMKTVAFKDDTIYNPQHHHGNGFGSLSIDSMDADEMRSKANKSHRKIPKKRNSDATWQKAHRSIFACCFRG